MNHEMLNYPIYKRLISFPLIFNKRMKSKNVKRCIPIQDLFPRCHPENPDLNKCLEEKSKYDDAVEDFPFNHLFERADCCLDVCSDRPPRFDDLYYIPSDKACRLYRRTWTECKSPLCKPKKFCCYENKSIPFTRRERGLKVEGVACETQKSDVLMECKKQLQEGECPTFKLPFCKAPRRPASCAKLKSPEDCIKICTPYPSFSECKKPKFRARSPRECYCMEKPDLCDVYDMVRKGTLKPKKRFKIK